MATQKKQKQTKSESISESKRQNTEGIGPLIEALVADTLPATMTGRVRKPVTPLWRWEKTQFNH
jgi:hypothetical protein